MKNYNQAPLPFQGQKRRFTGVFKQRLNGYDKDHVYVDLFGGSGLLSHNVKTIHPQAKVVYNDFDNFKQRLNSIENTNSILRELRVVLEGYPRNKRIIGEERDQVLEILTQADQRGFVDYVTLSSSLKFSMNYSSTLDGFVNDTLYNSVRKSNYAADGYLEGVDVVSVDYKVLFDRYKDDPNVVFLVDPPYLSNDCSTYLSDSYWQLKDYLDVLQVLVNQNYFYFTSNKSQIVELCQWISTVSSAANPFADAECVTMAGNSSYNSKYTDIMYCYKKE